MNRLSTRTALEWYKEDGAVRKRASRNGKALGEQRTKVASPLRVGGIPPRGLKRRRWARYVLWHAFHVLVVILSSCLATQWRQTCAQEPRDSDPMSAEPGNEPNSEGPLVPLPDMFEADALSDTSGDGFVLPADCGLGCAPSWYVQGEALFFVNEGHGAVSLSDAFALPDFSNELGMRVTVGRKRDCAEGWEVSYVGPLRWEVAGEVSGFPLDSDLDVPNGDVNISAFVQAGFHRQTYESTLHSLEVNQRFYDWDTMSCLIGLRYLDINEEFSFESQIPPPLAEQGLFTVDTRNRLIGPQCGLDMIHPVGASNRLSLIGKTKLGVYANFAEGDVRLVNAGVQELDNGDDDVALAIQGELGVQAHLRITRWLSIHCGYELWYLCGLALADGQTVSPLTQATGTNLDSDQDTWFHGATLGGQLSW